ncbi:Hypothetical protein, putative [Bodo saltans]|uniref:RNA helicase n=1 Tax=Bodo saltans TaxID=75058 RepID=A0A0S4IWR7_BODSA|nr:Hypothetical protein, putative [Bodo saltans]|eukprot:CUG31949.1 Hypothetical protein, putative [Bodo saltans]
MCRVCDRTFNLGGSALSRQRNWTTHIQSKAHRTHLELISGQGTPFTSVTCMTCGIEFKYSTSSVADWKGKFDQHLASRGHRASLQRSRAAPTAHTGEETCSECSGSVQYTFQDTFHNRNQSWREHRHSYGCGGTVTHQHHRSNLNLLPSQRVATFGSETIRLAREFVRKHYYPGQYEIIIERSVPIHAIELVKTLTRNNPFRRAVFARDDIIEFVQENPSLVNGFDIALRIRSIPRNSTSTRNYRSMNRRRLEPTSRGEKREMHGMARFEVELPRCPLPTALAQVRSYAETEQTCSAVLRTTSLAADATAHLHSLLYCEEACVKASLREYDLEGVCFTKGSFGLLRLRVPGLAEKRPSVLIDDVIEAIDATTNQCHQGYVHFVYHDEIDVHFSRAVVDGKAYDVHFTCKRTSFRALHRAIDRNRDLGRPILGLKHTRPNPKLMVDRFQPQLLARLNATQREFVEGAFTGQSMLNVLWGPPGTGKTTTVVAYIASLVALQPLPSKNIKVLVATPSNGASNLIVSKLCQFLTDKAILRVMALSRDKDEVPDDVQKCCLMISFEEHGRTVTRFRSPTADELNQATVVVSTLGSCGTLYGIHPSTTFTHVVVDECGQATEPEFASALQFGGLTRVVVAGDPKQLGPIVMSMAAQRKGLACSPLVRLIEHEKCPTTMLFECYRCHPSVLSAFNPVFYKGELKSAAAAQVKYSLGPIAGFPNKRVILIHCDGAESYDRKSPSIMNLHEVDIVDKQLSRLLSDGVKLQDIVILAPYALQVKKLREMLRITQPELKQPHNATWLKTQICSIEAFQGRESRVVILSCVRSPEVLDHVSNSNEVAEDVRRNLGFLAQPQRSNVALSRAIDGLIIVANVKLLIKDSRVWARVVDSLVDSNAQFVTNGTTFIDDRAFDLPQVVADVSDDQAGELDGDTTQSGIPRVEE